MAYILKEGTAFRKTDHVSREFCDQPMAQVDPKRPVTNVSYAATINRHSEFQTAMNAAPLNRFGSR
jgi:hypothetical protein